jgi:hypothetical protein
MSKGWKILFLVHLIVGLIFGLGYILLPDLVISLFGLSGYNPWLMRMIGAAILGFTASSWYGMAQVSYDRVRGIVMAEIVWTALGALVSLLGLLFDRQPPALWLNAIILALFAAVFSFLAYREDRPGGLARR